MISPRFYDELLPTSQLLRKPESSIHFHGFWISLQNTCKHCIFEKFAEFPLKGPKCCVSLLLETFPTHRQINCENSASLRSLVCTNISWTSIHCGINKTGMEAAPRDAFEIPSPAISQRFHYWLKWFHLPWKIGVNFVTSDSKWKSSDKSALWYHSGKRFSQTASANIPLISFGMDVELAWVWNCFREMVNAGAAVNWVQKL